MVFLRGVSGLVRRYGAGNGPGVGQEYRVKKKIKKKRLDTSYMSILVIPVGECLQLMLDTVRRG